MMEVPLLDFLRDYNDVLLPIGTFVLGFFVSRFTMSKKERKDYEQTLFQNGKELMELQHCRFQEFASSLQKYVTRTGTPTLDDFFELATIGEKYFYQLKISSEAVLADRVPRDIRDNTLVPGIKDAVLKSLPVFYSTLQEIAAKRNISYTGELKRENYESMYTVAEKYS